MAQITVDVVPNGVYLVVVWIGAEVKRYLVLNCVLSLTPNPSFRVFTKAKVTQNAFYFLKMLSIL